MKKEDQSVQQVKNEHKRSEDNKTESPVYVEGHARVFNARNNDALQNLEEHDVKEFLKEVEKEND